MASKRYLLADLSNNNVSVSLLHLERSGIAGFWHKVSEGRTFVDHEFAHRTKTARGLGLRVGGYHFARPSSVFEAQAEASHFCTHLGKIGPRDLAPVLDLEVTEGMSAKNLELWARAWMHRVHALTGVWPLFYSFPSFIFELHAKTVLGRGLWLASFSVNDGKEHPYVVPAPFKKALAHQFTSRGRLFGVSGVCDISSAPKLYPLLARGLRGL